MENKDENRIVIYVNPQEKQWINDNMEKCGYKKINTLVIDAMRTYLNASKSERVLLENYAYAYRYYAHSYNLLFGDNQEKKRKIRLSCRYKISIYRPNNLSENMSANEIILNFNNATSEKVRTGLIRYIMIDLLYKKELKNEEK